MNAVAQFAHALPRAALRRALLTLNSKARVGGDTERLRRGLVRRFELDLAGFLNVAVRDELEAIAESAKLENSGSIGELRARLWLHGAELEAGCREVLGTYIQPLPVVLRGKLVLQGAPRGQAPEAPSYPRQVPPSTAVEALDDEPDTIEELLERASELCGLRLGARGRDKGAYGARVAVLLGVEESGHIEPDWRGEVEIKTVPVVRDRSGWWRVKEDPAVSMEMASPIAKLRRVLWIARVADCEDSPILSWYYQEWDPEVAKMVMQHLHRRPKGGAGATTRGWYLHKRFFVDSGFLSTLNG
jgi:hypothetical protein